MINGKGSTSKHAQEGRMQWGYVYGMVYAKFKQVLVQKKAEAVFYNLKRTNLTIEALAEVCVGKFDTSQGLLLFWLELGLRIGEICGLNGAISTRNSGH